MTDSAAPGSGQPPPAVRLHYLDWLRILAILGVFLYHAARPFIPQDWLILNETRSIVLALVFLVFLGSFGMPLFFFISGAASYFALRRRSGRRFAAERLRRLMIPFVVGCVTLSPLQHYAEARHKGQFDGSLAAYLPVWVGARSAEISDRLSPRLSELIGSHLWFLAFLFSFVLLALPLFRWLDTARGQRALAGLGRALGAVRGGTLALMLPAVAARVILQPLFPDYTDWADFAFMFVFFVAGYLVYAGAELQAAVRRDWPIALGLGVACMVAVIALLALGVGQRWITARGTWGYRFGWGVVTVNGWCWTMAALAMGRRWFNGRGPALAYGKDAVLPFFVLHQPVIVGLAYVVVQLTAPLWLKYWLIVLGGLAVTLGLYELLVRRSRWGRALFGMKPLPARAPLRSVT